MPITDHPSTDTLAAHVGSVEIDPAILGIFETLTPLHPRGLGRTNLTLIAPTIVQTDTGVPFAGFGPFGSGRAGAVAMHVEPAAYGRTPGEQPEVVFEIQTDGPCSFAWTGAFDDQVLSGTASVDGHGSVTAPLGTYTGGAFGLASVQQTSGTTWRWTRLLVMRPWVLQNRF